MSCDDVAAAIVDEALPRPVDFQAHLEQCPRCRELARLHASASRLTLPDPPPVAPLARQAIQGEVRRRHHRRRALAGVAAVGAAAVLALVVMPSKPAPVPVTDTPAEALIELPRLDLLVEEIEGYTQRDPTFDDEAYEPFGTLALWVRPPSPTALSDRPFRTALAPLHPSPSPTQEPSR